MKYVHFIVFNIAKVHESFFSNDIVCYVSDNVMSLKTILLLFQHFQFFLNPANIFQEIVLNTVFITQFILA